MSTNDDSSNLFELESKKLQSAINTALEKPGNLSISEIVQLYFQVMNVSSLAKLAQQQSGNDTMTTKTEQLITGTFDVKLHPSILSSLEKSIADSMAELQSAKKEKTKEAIKEQAKLYEKLREKMSTKEFVEQYDKGLNHD